MWKWHHFGPHGHPNMDGVPIRTRGHSQPPRAFERGVQLSLSRRPSSPTMSGFNHHSPSFGNPTYPSPLHIPDMTGLPLDPLLNSQLLQPSGGYSPSPEPFQAPSGVFSPTIASTPAPNIAAYTLAKLMANPKVWELQERVNSMVDQNSRKNDQIDELRVRNDELRARNEELKGRIAELESKTQKQR